MYVQTLYSFHVGDCVEPLVYKDALERSCEVFDYARDELGLALSVMDIGGGFEGFEHLQGRFERTSAVVSASVKTVLAAYPNVTVFAEPGRLFARRTSILLTRVIGKRWIADKDEQTVCLDQIHTFSDLYTEPCWSNVEYSSLQRLVYCLNDGWYSSFMNWDSPTEIFKEMLPILLKVHMHPLVHACCLGVCMLHVLPHYCSVHAPLVSPTHECCRVTNHMNHAMRALSMVRAALQWMLLSKILNYQSWKWASGCSFQVSIAAQNGVTIMYAYMHTS